MPKESHYYDLLGVPTDADSSTIKKGYHKQAREYHPDKNPNAGDKFKEIANAYEVLSNPDKKAIYDEYGEEGIKEGSNVRNRGPTGTGNFAEDLINGFFEGAFFHPGHNNRGVRKTEDLVYHLDVTLEDMYNSKTTNLKLMRNIICGQCKGIGVKKQETIRGCKECKGTGVKITLRSIGPMFQQIQTACKACNGTGETIREKDKCKKCKGQRVVEDRKTLEVYVEKGMKHKEKTIFRGEGDQEHGTQPGDVIIILNEIEHKTFKRNGDDLHVEKEITLLEALTGVHYTMKHLDGRILKIHSKPGDIIKPGEVKEISNEGMPIRKRPMEKGTLFIKFVITFPESLNSDQINSLREVLGTGSNDEGKEEKGTATTTTTTATGTQGTEMKVDGDGEEVRIEEVYLEDYGAGKGKGKRNKRKEVYDEDDDERRHRGPQGATCAQQ
eukprot:TRINITY_DN5736_c0_g1_i1.p1 TRINITY_DN5736_c0_g1~~TRINITY_DN5736_c0_g1_i1.p1  ORF type:complete len:441 (+),score=114.25 TRINITY_DN5736_c0_g1_i1:127-1449(+)